VSASGQGFATIVVQWQKVAGRNHLPWQGTRDPYPVWLSEIMLQQTQVVTVVGYFDRFLCRFPTVKSLADAALDDVLGLWSGLGYYTRARNLYRCAQQVMTEHRGVFPSDAQTLATLPGIGRSTAAAIASLCFGEQVAILDANVKRVVTRVLGFDADLAMAASERALWNAATELLPTGHSAAADMPRYTQGMMDLGATVCMPKKPLCIICPVQKLCKAHAAGDAQRYPVRTRKLKRSSQSLWLLWAHTPDGTVLLEQRPAPGVWAGLYCLPLFDSEAALRSVLSFERQKQLCFEPVFMHVLTHKDLYLHVAQLELATASMEVSTARWMLATEWPSMGLPAPIRRLLTRSV
jgi:A/G-specific adenine glycosylase